MVWIKEKANELDSIDDLESSLVMLEDAATKMEVFVHFIRFLEHIRCWQDLTGTLIHVFSL